MAFVLQIVDIFVLRLKTFYIPLLSTSRTKIQEKFSIFLIIHDLCTENTPYNAVNRMVFAARLRGQEVFLCRDKFQGNPRDFT